MFDRFEDAATLPYDVLTSDPTDHDVSSDLDSDHSRTIDDARFDDSRIDVELLPAQVVTSTLPMSAPRAFDIFCDADLLPNWVSVVKSTSVLEWTKTGRPKRVAFLSRLKGASIGYTLDYEYDEANFVARWGTRGGASTNVRGRARFTPLGDRASLIEYKLVLELPVGALPQWEDPIYNDNAASAVVHDFRDYLYRRK